MKIIISSKYLASRLRELDLDSESIHLVAIDNGMLYVHTPFRFISMEIHSDSSGTEMQKNVRWDWIKETVSNIQDQPITIEFTENKAVIYLEF